MPEAQSVLPDMSEKSFVPDPEIIEELKKAVVWSVFCSFPELYQRIRINNLMFYKDRKKTSEYERGLSHLIESTKQGKMFGEWNDYGRLVV